MIKLQDAELISILPPYLKEDPDIQAVSYAFKMGMAKFLHYAWTSALYGNIDKLPEYVIDLMALEMRGKYYEESLDIAVKRELVKNSLAWYLKGGTVSVVEEMVKEVFGGGKLEEWYEFGGNPGTFRVQLDGEQDQELDTREVIRKINLYKKLSAHIYALGIRYRFTVAVSYANRIRFITAFYPRMNLPQLQLDGAWKLDGSRKLDGYDGSGRVNFYPVRLRVQAGAGLGPYGGNAAPEICFRAGVEGAVKPAPAIHVRASAVCPVLSHGAARARVPFPVACNVRVGDVRVYNKSRLDGAWKLDGSRKLDGGVSVL